MRSIFYAMDYFTQEFAVPEFARRHPVFARRIAAFLFGMSRLTNPQSNRSAERALAASHARTEAALEKDAADDWKDAGDALSESLGQS